MIDKYSIDPGKRELIRNFNDIILRMMFFCYQGDRTRMVRESLKYDFMWERWIEAIYGYVEPPTPEHHRGIVKPPWFSNVDDDV